MAGRTASVFSWAKHSTLHAFSTIRFWIFELIFVGIVTVIVLIWQPTWAKAGVAMTCFQVIMPILGALVGLLLVYLISIFIAPYHQHNELRDEVRELIKKCDTLKNEKEELIGQLNKREPTRSDINTDFSVAKVVWGQWHTGTKMRAESVEEKGKLTRVLLLRPEGSNKALRKAVKKVGDRTGNKLEAAISDIKYLTIDTLNKGIEVKWHTQYVGYSFTIYDPSPKIAKDGELIPNSDDAWIVQQYLDPSVSSGLRTMRRIFKKEKGDLENFNALFNEFETMWNKSPELNDDDKKLLEGKFSG